MKTAISIPNDIFQEADMLAKRLGFSRSELYTKAVKALLEKNRGEHIVKTLNELYAQESSTLDTTLQLLQDLTFTLEEW